MTIDGTLSQYHLLTACFTFYLEFKTILILWGCLYTNIYITAQLVANTLYWMDTLPYTFIKIDLSACLSLTRLKICYI